MRGAVFCPGNEAPEFSGSGGMIICSGGSAPVFVGEAPGLGDLAWSDVSLLLAAVLVSFSIATAWQMAGSFMWGRR